MRPKARVTARLEWRGFMYYADVLLVAGLVVSCLPCFAQAGLDKVNEFPVKINAEGFPDHPTKLSAEFQVFFPSDSERYLPVNTDVIALLSLPPVVRSKPGIHVRVLGTSCIPKELTVLMGPNIGTVTGGVLKTEFEISIDRGVAPGMQQIVLAFPTIDLLFLRVNPSAPAPKAEVQVEVLVWRSPQAEVAAERRAREDREREEETRQREIERQETARRLELQREEETRQKERRRAWQRTIRIGLVALPFVVFTMGILYWQRDWIRPKARISISPGGFEQLHRVMVVPQNKKSTEPGVILNTEWARNRFYRRQRIKVELFASEDADQVMPRTNELQEGHDHTSDGSDALLDLLVSVGSSVRPGTYLAKLPNGAVRIRVNV